MVLGILTLLSALSISAVAIYYSVAGLAAIFAAAVIPIIIMGVTLEVGKLVTAVWLHKNWGRSPLWLKSYLGVAVIVLMFITSMGIFGYLSKAHIEQTTAGQENMAQVERVESELARYEEIIVRAEDKIKKLESSGTGADANIQSQIDKEQKRIEDAYKRIQPAIDEQQAIIDSQSELWRNELDKIDQQMTTLQGYIDNGETKKAQQMIGASADGIFGTKTADRIGEWQDKKNKERIELLEKIEQSSNNPQARAAAEEIKRLRKTAETQITQSNQLIDRLRKQLGNEDKAADVDSQVDELNLRIKNANTEIDALVDQKYKMQGEYRKLEAEVGPIKFIAEFIYGENADTNLLEAAVRWVIIIIIFVFDPLAVLLLIASQYTFNWSRKENDYKKYEDARAQKIADNKFEMNNGQPFVAESYSDLEAEHYMNSKTVQANDVASSYNIDKPNDEFTLTAPGEDFEKKDPNIESLEESKNDLDSWNEWVDAANKAAEQDNLEGDKNEDYREAKQEDVESMGQGQAEQSPKPEVEDVEQNLEQQENRLKELEDKEEDTAWIDAKRKWKKENPEQNIKDWKEAYVQGKIDEVPWQSYVDAIIDDMKAEGEWPSDPSKKKTYIKKEGKTQVRKKTQDPNTRK